MLSSSDAHRHATTVATYLLGAVLALAAAACPAVDDGGPSGFGGDAVGGRDLGGDPGEVGSGGGATDAADGASDVADEAACDDANCPEVVTSAPPVIEALTATPSVAPPLGAITVTALVSDPDGAADVFAGSLEDLTTGTSYGSFDFVAPGEYRHVLSWGALGQPDPVESETGRVERRLRATFWDRAEQAASAEVVVAVACEEPGLALCFPGVCVDLDTDVYNCGGCGGGAGRSGQFWCDEGTLRCQNDAHTDCGSTCQDLTSPYSCQACDNRCDQLAEQLVDEACLPEGCYGHVVERTTRTRTCAQICSSLGLECRRFRMDWADDHVGSAAYGYASPEAFYAFETLYGCNDAPPATRGDGSTSTDWPWVRTDCACQQRL